MPFIILKNLGIPLLKNIGFGLVATATQDELFEDTTSPYNIAAMVFGACSWLAGIYLEAKFSDPNKKSYCNSTNLIQKGLGYSAGLGVVNGVTHLIKQKYLISANVSNLMGGLWLYPSAIQELEKATTSEIPKLKWEKLRFLVLFAGDYLSATGIKHLINSEYLDLFTLISMPIGLALSISEGVYGYKNDIGLNISSTLNRRAFKLSIGLGSIFILKNILMGSNDKYSIADNTYSVLTTILLFAALVELRRLAKTEIQVEDLTSTLIEEKDLESNSDYRALPSPRGGVAIKQ